MQSEAVALKRVEIRECSDRAALSPGERTTVARYAAHVLERKRDGRILTKSKRRYKDSSLDTEAAALARLTARFGTWPLGSVERGEAIVWAEARPRG